jgi:hypothetical protein
MSSETVTKQDIENAVENHINKERELTTQEFKETQDRINRYIFKVIELQHDFEKKFLSEKLRYDTQTEKLKRKGDVLASSNRVFTADMFNKNIDRSAEAQILFVLKKDIQNEWGMDRQMFDQTYELFKNKSFQEFNSLIRPNKKLKVETP